MANILRFPDLTYCVLCGNKLRSATQTEIAGVLIELSDESLEERGSWFICGQCGLDSLHVSPN